MLTGNGSEQAARYEIETRFGTTVFEELELTIAGVRVFPTVKRGLGIAVSCLLPNLGIDTVKSLFLAERFAGDEDFSTGKNLSLSISTSHLHAKPFGS